jgi:cytochrome c biogenesis factor
VTVQAIVNPLVSWIWTGGIVLSIGAIICLLPRLIPVSAPVPTPEPAVLQPTRQQRGKVSAPATA